MKKLFSNSDHKGSKLMKRIALHLSENVHRHLPRRAARSQSPRRGSKIITTLFALPPALFQIRRPGPEDEDKAVSKV